MKKVSFVKAMLSMILVLAMGLPAAASAAGSGALDEATKREWYEEYQKIIEEVSPESKLGDFGLTLSPFEDFKEKDWKTPREFRAFAKEMAGSYVGMKSGPVEEPLPAGSAAKRVYLTIQGVDYGIDIVGDFHTQYEACQGRLVFSGAPSFTSLSAGAESWSHIGMEARLIDGGRTCSVTVSGRFTLGGVSKIYLARAEFYCDPQGNIS